jgi:hypothetical protein
MRRVDALRVLGCFSATTLGGCQGQLCWAVPPSSGTASKPTQFGSTIYAVDDVERTIALIAGCGGTYVRIGVNGRLGFADAVFAAAARHGVRVILISDYAGQPVNADAYAQSCAAIQLRYAAYNPVWEIWNEPNLGFYWGAKPNVDDYSKLAIAAGKGLRGAGARDVWSGGTSGIDSTWIFRMKRLGVFDVLNGCAVHSYVDPCAALGEYDIISGTLPAGVRIHTTETCVPSTQGQADFLRQMWYVHRIMAIPTMIWCELRDGTAGVNGPYAFPYGLVDPNYQKKPSYFAAQELISSQRPKLKHSPNAEVFRDEAR